MVSLVQRPRGVDGFRPGYSNLPWPSGTTSEMIEKWRSDAINLGIIRNNEKHSHYKKDVLHLSTLDIYRVLELFEVRSHAVGHAIKKLLMAGNRGAKDYEQDIQEAIDSLNRELQMKQEDSNG